MLLNQRKRDLVLQAFAAGAHGVFCRDDSIESLRKCIRAVHSGQVWANSIEMHYLLEALVGSVPKQLTNAKCAALLSKRELDVVGCVSEGLSNREIAARLNLSEHTVKNYMFRIFDKLGVSTRVEMVLYAFSNSNPDNKDGNSLPPAHPQITAPLTATHHSQPENGTLARYRGAAEEGSVVHQLGVAEMYRQAKNGAADKTAAYMWYLIAEAFARDLSAKGKVARLQLGSELSVQEKAEAQKRATKWLEQHSSNGSINGTSHGPGNSVLPPGNGHLTAAPQGLAGVLPPTRAASRR
jgi:DNA-binding CsgD family transcriptional regulator